ncbi:MAG TPA: MFS transporter, partial [Dehalococcoidales bacterium]|nr:MFS transporter [Dehalococcoidales bacterium]
MFSSLRLRNFSLFLSGTTLSNAAQWIQQVTLSWLAYDLSGSGTVLGSINVVRSVASLSLTPVAGVMIDRFNRRSLLLMVNGWLFTFSLVLGLVLVFASGRLSYLFIFAFLGGFAQPLDMSLRQVLVFDLVPRRLAPNAVALIQTGWSLMRSLGPGIGGFLILWFGPGGNFLIQAAAYALIAISIFWIRFPPQAAALAGSSPLQNIREGILFVAKNRVTRTFMMMGWVLPLFIIPNYVALPPIYAKDIFHGGPQTLGFLMASVGVGGIAGGVVVAALGRMERRGLLQLVSLFLLSVTLIAFAFSTNFLVALVFLALSGFFEMIYLTTNQTLLQLSIPDDLRGRVTSIVNLNAVLSPLGAFVAGASSDLLGG